MRLHAATTWSVNARASVDKIAERCNPLFAAVDSSNSSGCPLATSHLSKYTQTLAAAKWSVRLCGALACGFPAVVVLPCLFVRIAVRTVIRQNGDRSAKPSTVNCSMPRSLGSNDLYPASWWDLAVNITDHSPYGRDIRRMPTTITVSVGANAGENTFNVVR